jgi:pyruvate/2-oxoglutarate/acetoin dehydrogenase E1 component
VPGLKVVLPSTPADAKGLLTAAIREDNPVLFIEHKLLYSTKGDVPAGEHCIPLGRAEIKRAGRDVTIVTISHTVLKALRAAARMAAEGIEAEVIDLRTLAPLDLGCVLDSVRRTNRVVIAHEACRRGGFGGELAAQIQEEAFDFLDAPIQRVGALDVPIPYSKPMEEYVIPDEERIIAAAKRALGKK